VSELKSSNYVSKAIPLAVQSLCVELASIFPAWVQPGDPGMGSHHPMVV